MLTSSLFALLHDPWRFVPILFVAMLFGYLVSRGRSIYYGMVAHAVTNATSVAGGNLFGIQAGRQISVPVSFVILMIAVLAISIAGFARSTEKEEALYAGSSEEKPVLGKSPTALGNNAQHPDTQ